MNINIASHLGSWISLIGLIIYSCMVVRGKDINIWFSSREAFELKIRNKASVSRQKKGIRYHRNTVILYSVLCYLTGYNNCRLYGRCEEGCCRCRCCCSVDVLINQPVSYISHVHMSTITNMIWLHYHARTEQKNRHLITNARHSKNTWSELGIYPLHLCHWELIHKFL